MLAFVFYQHRHKKKIEIIFLGPIRTFLFEPRFFLPVCCLRNMATAHTVPPRRGQRIKSRILPPFNRGTAFQLVRLIDDDSYGVVAQYDASGCDVWIGHDLLPTRVPTERLELVSLPVVPERAYDEYEATIGGVGKHNRWLVIMGGATELLVYRIEDCHAFRDFVQTRLGPFGMSSFEFTTSADGAHSTVVHVPDPAKAGMVAAALHCSGYHAALANPKERSKLCIERYDRSEHMWWNQTQDRAGPLRDTHRWRYDYIPNAWVHIPFTWQSMCKNISIDAETEASCLPLPLRDYYITYRIECAADDAQKQRLARMREHPSVTCRLTQEQNTQLLTAGYWNTIAPFNATALELARLVRFRYMVQGLTCREIGKYNQNANNLGHGHGIRVFKNKPQYDRANLPIATLNVICQPDGTMRGSGFKGTRGKYGHADFKKYEPRKRMRRTKRQEDNMRRATADALAAYDRCVTGAASTA